MSYEICSAISLIYHTELRLVEYDEDDKSVGDLYSLNQISRPSLLHDEVDTPQRSIHIPVPIRDACVSCVTKIAIPPSAQLSCGL